jgi:ATP-binding cassette subfamily B protein
MEHRSNALYASSAHRRDKGSIRSLRELKPYLRPYRGTILLAVVALMFTSAAMLGMGGALRYLVDYGIAQGDPHLLDRGFMMLLGVVGMLAAASYARFYLVSSLGEKLINDIRRDVFARVMAMDMPYFESTRMGELLSRMTADTQLLQVVLTTTLSTAARNVLMLIGGTILLMLTSHKLTLMVLAMLPIVITPIIVLGKRVRHWSRETQSRLAEVNVETEETIYGIRTIQSFSLEAHQRGRFERSLEGVLHAAMMRIRLRSALTGIVIGLVFGAVMTVLWMGGRDVLAGNITSGQLSSFVFYAVLVAGSTGALSDILGELQRAAGAAERVLELLVQRPTIASPEQPIALPQPLQGQLDFAGVTFFYPAQTARMELSTEQGEAARAVGESEARGNISPTLKNITLSIQAGEMVAIVGPSGAGKTTMLQLLQRFYDPSSGSVLLDGVDLRRLSLQDLRGVMGLVPQDPVIFSTTIGENIGIGSAVIASEQRERGNPDWVTSSAMPPRNDEAIYSAAQQAAALEFIEKLPDGFDTYVGEKGVRLSGGQKQRIAIARALLRNPRILLLDEATSALDAESERLVQQAIGQAMENRTTIVVAHRLATVKRAHRIVVMNEGCIEAIGTHEELLAQSPLYARLAQLQFTS